MVLEELLSRAVSDVVPRPLAEQKLKSGQTLRVYLGIDPTGAKLHLGHSVPLRKLKAFQDAGHHVIFVIGSFTAMIGDPSGRDTQREPLTREQVMENFETYKEQAGKILDFSKIEIRYNHEWLEKLDGKKLLELASHFTIQQMEERDMYEKRRQEGNPIGTHEFLYPLFVGYDSVVLDVDCEIGGNDQLFNMLCGRDLQKRYGKRDKFVLTTTLIEGTDGRKMSKTYDNCITLTDEAKDMYGKLMSIRDELIAPYMECVTEMPMNDVKEAERAMKNGANPKDYKMRLAREVVSLYHGQAAGKHAEEEFERVFRKKEVPEDMPQFIVKKGIRLVEALVQAGIVPSGAEARRLVTQKAIHVSDRVVASLEEKVEEGIVKVGKRKWLRIAFKK